MVAEDSSIGTMVEDRDRTRRGSALETEREPSNEALAADLRAACDGDVRFDEYARVLYATDGSIYGAQPAGVVIPRDTADVRAAVRVAADYDAPVLPRGAGSSLAGQAVGPNCVVLDLSRHMDGIRSIDPDERTAVVQPGVVQDDLDAALEPHGLKFHRIPPPQTGATIGGGIGTTRRVHTRCATASRTPTSRECEVVLADGSRIRLETSSSTDRNGERIVSKDDREAAIYRTVRRLVEDNAAEIESGIRNSSAASAATICRR